MSFRNNNSGSWSIVQSLLILFLIFSGCSQGSNNSNHNSKAQEPCINVDLAKVESKNLQETIQGIGSLQAWQNVLIKPEIAGMVEQIHFQEGQEVQKGQILFTLDAARIKKRLKARQAALQEARAEQENARRTYKRRQKLFERKLGTEEARDEAETAYEAAQARIRRLQAEIGEIRETLKDSKITSPFQGILGERLVDTGDWVDVGTPLVSLVQKDKLKISFTVAERYMGRVKEGQKIRILSQAYPEKRFSGEVYFISPSIRLDTRDLLVKAYVDNPDQLLRPGGFASVELTVGVRKNVAVIPEEALIPTRTGYMVFVLQDSRAKERDVQIGLRRPGIVEIRQGLKPGETIVSSGHVSVYEGALCRSQKEGS